MKEKKKDINPIRSLLTLFHQDGVIDLVAGATLVNFGFDILNKNETTSLFTWIPILLFSSLKQKTTIPRLHEELQSGDKDRIRKWTFIPAAGMIIGMIILGILVLGDPFNLKETSNISLPGNFHSLVSSFILALICIVPALWIGLKRFLVYSAVALTSGIVCFFFFPTYVSFFLTAAVMIALGARLMIIFSREYPIPEEGKSSEN